MANVLLVEDDTFYAEVLKEYLQDIGVNICCVISAEEALGKEISAFDAAIIDVMIPNNPELSGISILESRGNYLAGVAVARRLREKIPDMPIILFSADVAGDEARDWAQRNDAEYILKSDGSEAVYKCLIKYNLVKGRKIKSFLVHGQDEAALLELKNYLQNTLGFDEPIVLREQKNGGKTIIEKFEECARYTDIVFVLLTPDDIAVSATATDDKKRRARQNVIFELGFFYGKLGRLSGKIIVLHKGPIELPSDIQGVVWIDISSGITAAGESIRKEVAV